MTNKADKILKIADQAIVQAGYGRGFVVHGEYGTRYILTAAHCLPRTRYPRPHLLNSTNELALPNIIGPLRSKKSRRDICAEICCLNLADDLAVLGEPDSQNASELHDRYAEFTAGTGIKLAKSPAVVEPYLWATKPGENGWVLSLDCSWVSCTIHNNGRFLTLRGAKIESGMSGSPILDAAGAAIGLISTGSEDYNVHPSLTDCLPPWLKRKLGRGRKRERIAIEGIDTSGIVTWPIKSRTPRI
jgi:hypothetical protein